jgi:hypothetical protein
LVRYESGGPPDSRHYRAPAFVPSASVPNAGVDLAHLTETIANATALLKAAGFQASTPNAVETYDPSYWCLFCGSLFRPKSFRTTLFLVLWIKLHPNVAD